MLERHAEREQFVVMTMRLVAEYAGRLPAGAVTKCVATSREELMQLGLRRSGLLTATEHMARVRLRQRLPAHAPEVARAG